jgi:hypothetical protein
MGTIIEKPNISDKIVMWGCIALVGAILVCLPSMINDKNKRLEQAWQTQGCEMYDNYKATDIPAKCSQYFIDHYKSQDIRIQPPEEGASNGTE